MRVQGRHGSSGGGRVRLHIKVRACVGPCAPVVGCAEVCATRLNKQVDLGLMAFEQKTIQQMPMADQLMYLQVTSEALNRTNDESGTADDDH